MNNISFQTISRIKLEELNKHYQKMSAFYDNLIHQTTQITDPAQKLKTLYNGLSSLTFAHNKIHPDVDNLDVIWAKIEAGTASDTLLNHWINRLQKELSQGKNRLDAGLLFGLLLEESTFSPLKNQILPSQTQAETHWINLWHEKKNPQIDKLIDWWDNYTAQTAKIPKALNAFLRMDNTETSAEFDICAPLYTPIYNHEVITHLTAIVSHPYHHAYTTQEAQQILTNDALITEFAGALNIMLQHIEEWNWKQDDGLVQSVWTRNKWRPFQQTNLLDTLFLEIIGTRWGIFLKSVMQKHILVDKTTSSYNYNYNVEYYRNIQKQNYFLPNVPSYYPAEYNPQVNGNYGGENNDLQQETNMNALLNGICKEILYFQTRHKNNPEEQLFITQIDIKDYFTSLSSEVLVEMLEMIGIKGLWLDFFRKYFSLNYTLNNQKIAPNAGIPLCNMPSFVLADVLLEWLRPMIEQENGFMYRVLDDIYLVANKEEIAKKIWEKTNYYLNICDLKINPDKMGAVQIQNNPTKKLADSAYISQFANLPQWYFLEITPEGTLKISQKKTKAYQKIITEQLREKNTIFQIVNSYNADLMFFIKGIAPMMPIGKYHLEQVNKILAEISEHLFGQHESIFDFLRKKIIARFPHLEKAILALPETWFFFPVTAGGLALTEPFCHIASLKSQQENVSAPYPPHTIGMNETEVENAWGYFYHYLVGSAFLPQSPTSTVIMDSLLRDFIQRGGEVKGSTQSGLGTYWKWLLYTYGHELLEAFGTFRFVITELVPLQAIYQNNASANAGTISQTTDDLPF